MRISRGFLGLTIQCSGPSSYLPRTLQRLGDGEANSSPVPLQGVISLHVIGFHVIGSNVLLSTSAASARQEPSETPIF